ncbi:PREDICTED: protein NUCLEAR FUSION DEFECTIVE 6, chloroplastic/mitochondrial-like isoform X3 [Nelumbo nucifera]|uniref:Protein NUCLEAR FUSION DEFECTIVE 6, chloroplastic/mitochondrial-like isoform X3 n=1 Tax=Nelumbo nucifera TaxID=4432 RepID=A0A1U8B5D2_NELNU|nr:PREDICTED: protein NUCLEAR FUSION DEFECTIVE 6, chloroplastic/mitochondrial-like isoform X3 [Nelumbo nucifera]
MAAAFAVGCARSVLRSSTVRNAAARIATEAKAARSPCGILKRKPHSNRFFRSPVEMSFCVESLLPYHTATASALLTSMLSVSHRRDYNWLSEACNDDV